MRAEYRMDMTSTTHAVFLAMYPMTTATEHDGTQHTHTEYQLHTK
jgi:hypothetical protein